MEQSDGMQRRGHRSVWRNRVWRRLTAAQGLSAVGDWAYAVALVVWIGERTDASPVWIAATMVVRLLPIAVLAPFGGALADRIDRRRILLVADAARAASMVALLVLIAGDGPIVLGLAIAAATECLTAFARPAYFSATPQIVEEDDLAAASAIGSVVNQVAILCGPVVAGILIAVSSVEAVIVVDVITFGASFVLTALVPPILPVRGSTPVPPAVPEDSRGMLRSLLAVPGLPVLVSLIALSEVVYGAEAVLQPLVAFERLGDPAALGIMAAAVGLGGFLVAPTVARVAGRRRLVRAFIAANLLGAMPLMALALTRSTTVAAVILLAEGCGLVLYEVVAYMLILRTVPAEHLGRALGFRETVVTGGQLVGAFATPIVVSIIGLEWTLVLTGGALVVGALLAWAPLEALDDRAAARADELEPIVTALRASAMLADATQAALERMAGAVRGEHIAAGTRVITEGDAADDVWFVRSGAFVASLTDRTGRRRELSEMGAGAWFGEIGVIGRRARTADVTCTADATVWRLPGTVLLASIEAGVRFSDPAARLMEARLGRSDAAGGAPPVA
ncbi:MAG: MFS transporter [Actinomycetes bacterium]